MNKVWFLNNFIIFSLFKNTYLRRYFTRQVPGHPWRCRWRISRPTLRSPPHLPSCASLSRTACKCWRILGWATARWAHLLSGCRPSRTVSQRFVLIFQVITKVKDKLPYLANCRKISLQPVLLKRKVKKGFVAINIYFF